MLDIVDEAVVEVRATELLELVVLESKMDEIVEATVTELSVIDG